MSKRTSAKKKISRKLGGSLWGQAKDPYNKRNYKPGQHGASQRSRASDYSNQLRAKQRMKFYYGNITEKQFFNLFQLAEKTRGDVSENFVALLESRLDAIIYRANFVQVKEKSRKLAITIETLEKMERDVPSYLQLDKDTFSIQMTTKASFAEGPYAIEMEPHLITEYYSR